MLLDQIGMEPIVSGRNGSMRGEDNLAGNSRHCCIESDSLVLHAHTNRFQHGERAMTFVEVQNSRSNPQRSQSSEPAHTEQQLLPNTDAEVSAIQTRRQLAVLWSVPVHVRIQQIQISPSDLNPPNFCLDFAAASLDLHDDRPAVFADSGLHRQLGYVGLEIIFPLPASKIEVLPKVSLAVKQADAYEWNVQIRRTLDVIS